MITDLSPEELATIESLNSAVNAGYIKPNADQRLILKLAGLAAQPASPQGEVVAWMTEDGRVAANETKVSSMHKHVQKAFCIPLVRATPPTPPAEPKREVCVCLVPEIADDLGFCIKCGWEIVEQGESDG